MSGLPMSKFEIVDLPGMKTVAFSIEKTEQDFLNGGSLFTLQKIDAIDEAEKKVFYMLPDGEKEHSIVLLTLTKNKALLNTGTLVGDEFEVSDSPVPINYSTIFNQEDVEYKEFAYTPNMKRIFSIVDAETGEEVKPVLYADKETNQIKGKCMLLPNKHYIALQLRCGIDE